MSNLPSKATKTVAVRLPNEVVAIIARRASKQDMLVSEYLKRHLIRETIRKHRKKEVR